MPTPQRYSRTLLALGLVLGSALLSCCTDDLPPPSRRPGERAVGNPVSVNSPENEFLGSDRGAAGSNTAVFPLIQVDLPNDKDDSAKVTTIMDAMNTTSRPRNPNHPPPARHPFPLKWKLFPCPGRQSMIPHPNIKYVIRSFACSTDVLAVPISKCPF